MNKERLLALADLIETRSHPKINQCDLTNTGFNMSAFWDTYTEEHGWDCSTDGDILARDCDTCCCIAGWTQILIDKKVTEESPLGVEESARQYLDLDLAETEMLFWCRDMLNASSRNDMSQITPSQAAAVLRNLADPTFAKVDWAKAVKENPA